MAGIALDPDLIELPCLVDLAGRAQFRGDLHKFSDLQVACRNFLQRGDVGNLVHVASSHVRGGHCDQRFDRNWHPVLGQG